MDGVPEAVREWLRTSAALARLCTQNGWIDPDTIRAEVVDRWPDGSLVLAVCFEEIVVEAAGCVGTTVPCYGRVRIRLDGDRLLGAEIL